MLRLLVAALLLANLLFFTWSRGWLDAVVGIPAQGDREPQRLASQVKPELVTLLPAVSAAGAASEAASAAGPAASTAAAAGPAPAASATSLPASAPNAIAAAAMRAASTTAAASAPVSPLKAAASAPAASKPDAVRATPTVTAPAASAVRSPPDPPTPAASAPAAAAPASASASSAAAPASSAASLANACLEAGPFGDTELAAAEGTLRNVLPAGAWEQRKAEGGGEWMIYMGPYPEPEALERKKGELGRIRGGVPQEEVTAPAELANGLSLGRYPSQAAANATLAQYRTRGIRTARVVRSGPGTVQNFLRVPQAEPTLASRVAALKLPGSPRRFTACPR